MGLFRRLLRGARLPNPRQVAADRATDWTSIAVPQWYGTKERVVEVVSAEAVRYGSGSPAVPVRWVLIRDPRGELKTQALPCTDLGVAPEWII